MNRACGIMLVGLDGKVLIGRRSSSGDHAGEWSWFGGKVEDNESDIEALKRELQEETGYDGELLELSIVHENDRGHYVYVTYMGVVDCDFVPSLNDEHDDYMWVDMRELPHPLHPGIIETIEYLS